MKASLAVAALAAAALHPALAAATPVRDGVPMTLPPAGARAANAHLPTTWIIGLKDSATARRVAIAAGARLRSNPNTATISTGRARALGTRLRRRGLLRFAEPNVTQHRASAFEGHTDAWARAAVVPPTLAPPPIGPSSTIAVVDDPVDPSVTDIASHTRYIHSIPPEGYHGTEVASAASALADGEGVVGIFPGAQILSYGLPQDITCADTADGIAAASRAKARVINLSLGGDSDCFDLFAAVQRAYAKGSLVVASGGNDFQDGNPVVYPAAYPHVLSVAAVDPTLHWADFSNANVAIDVSAPGVAVPVDIPLAADTQDGAQDGVTLADGTSFAAPIVSGAAAWLATARPALSSGQIADLLRHTALDLEGKGYDAETGYGLIQLQAALNAPTPKQDPQEPNDGITWVNGTAFGKPEPRIWNGGTKPKELQASVDAVEDPLDVYRIRVPRKSAFEVKVTPLSGDPALTIYSGKAKSIDQSGAVIARSDHSATRSETIKLANDSGSARSAYVGVRVSGRSKNLVSTYDLLLKRIRRR